MYGADNFCNSVSIVFNRQQDSLHVSAKYQYQIGRKWLCSVSQGVCWLEQATFNCGLCMWPDLMHRKSDRLRMYMAKSIHWQYNENDYMVHPKNTFALNCVQGPLYNHGYTFIPALINNQIFWRVWNEITYLFPNFNGCIADVWEWISNLISQFIIYVITLYPCGV